MGTQKGDLQFYSENSNVLLGIIEEKAFICALISLVM